MSSPIRIGALWKKTDKNGKPMLSGEIEIEGVKRRILIYENDKKGIESLNRPDYNIVMYNPEELK